MATAAGWRSISTAHIMCSKIMPGMNKLPFLLHFISIWKSNSLWFISCKLILEQLTGSYSKCTQLAWCKHSLSDNGSKSVQKTLIGCNCGLESQGHCPDPPMGYLLPSNTLFLLIVLRPVRLTCRAVFKWLSKVITWLRLLRLVIG